MTDLPLVYTTRSDCDLDFLPEKEKWYAARHAPDLLRAGFDSAQSYHSEIGTPLVCNVYEIPGLHVFSTREYIEDRAKDPRRAEILSHMSNLSTGIYEQALVSFPPPHGPFPAGAITRPCITTVRLDVREERESAFRDFYATQAFPRLAHLPAFAAGRLCQQNAQHPTLKSFEPRWMVILEWDSAASAKADGTPEAVFARLHEALPGALSNLAYNLSNRAFRLARPTR